MADPIRPSRNPWAASQRPTRPDDLVMAPSVDVARRRRFEESLGRGHQIHIYSGSSKGTCSRCGNAVWIGPRSREVVDAGGAKPVCETCLGTVMALTGWRPKAITNLENPETTPHGS